VVSGCKRCSHLLVVNSNEIVPIIYEHNNSEVIFLSVSTLSLEFASFAFCLLKNPPKLFFSESPIKLNSLGFREANI